MSASTPASAADAVAVLLPLAGKFACGSVEIFGNLPVRPGDTFFGLLAVKRDGPRIDLVFAAQGEEADESRHFALSIWGPRDVKGAADHITVGHAERVKWASTDEWVVHGKQVETVGSKERAALPRGPAVSLR